MQHYVRYIARNLLHSALLITFSLTSIIWLTQALRFIDYIVNQGVSVGVFLQLTTLLIPSLFLLILPPAFFAAIIFTYNKLMLDSEIIVLQSSGLSKLQLVRPVITVGLGFTLIAYLIAFYIQPISYNKFRDSQLFLRNNYASLLLQEGVFNNPVTGLTVFIRDRMSDGTLKGILVQDNRQQQIPVTLLAEQGRIVPTDNGPRFLLENGNRQELKDGALSLLNFESYGMDLSLYNKANADRIFDVQELFLPDLFNPEPTLPMPEQQKRRAEGHQRILWPAYILTLGLFAAMVMLSGEFNRRGQWKRILLASFSGLVIIFSSISLRGIVAMHPGLVILLYLNLLIPAAFAITQMWGGKQDPHELRA